jgi:hypothetical protein
MSYAFHLLPYDPTSASPARLKAKNPPPTRASEARRRRLMAALLDANPGFEVNGADIKAVARSLGISVREGRKRDLEVQLCAPGDSGIQISLHNYSAYLTVPFGHKGKKAKAVFKEIWNYLNVMQEIVPEWRIYDPQTEQVIGCFDFFEGAFWTYSGGKGNLDGW